MYNLHDGTQGVSYYSIDYLRLYINETPTTTYYRSQYGYYNDMSNITWVDASPYALPVDVGADMNIEDDEGGHTWGAVNDTGLSVDVSTYPYVEIWIDEGTVDTNWDNWSLRVLWSNGSSYYVFYQLTDLSGNEYTYNLLSLCDSENTTITDIEIVCNGDDDLGDDLAVWYLNIYDIMWHSQEVVFNLLGEQYTGMLLAGVALIGLVMIPGGMVLGAFMVKNNRGAKIELLFRLFLPMMIMLLGFAFFIGGIT